MSDVELLSIWSEVVKKAEVFDRSANPIPMTNCYRFGKRNGYSYYGRGHGNTQLQLSHVALWIKDKDECIRALKAKDKVAAHRCHFKPCINPDHLFWTTRGHNSSCNGCPAYATLPDGKVLRVCSHGRKKDEYCLMRDPNCPSEYYAEFV